MMSLTEILCTVLLMFLFKYLLGKRYLFLRLYHSWLLWSPCTLHMVIMVTMVVMVTTSISVVASVTTINQFLLQINLDGLAVNTILHSHHVNDMEGVGTVALDTINQKVGAGA